MHLLTLPDEAVLAALALVMAETLEAGTALIEMLGRHLKLDMAETHAVDDVLLDLVKDREVLDRLVADVAGEQADRANARATGKGKRQSVPACPTGQNGSAEDERDGPRREERGR